MISPLSPSIVSSCVMLPLESMTFYEGSSRYVSEMMVWVKKEEAFGMVTDGMMSLVSSFVTSEERVARGRILSRSAHI